MLPEDRADVLYHQYDGGGVKIDGPSLLMRKKFAEKYSVSANYYVDLVSSASIDVVTTASPYKEERQQLGLGFDMLNGKTQYSVGFTNSDENDYTANQASFDISQDMFGDLTTVSFGFSRGWDEVRRRDDDEFSESVDRRTWRLGLSQIVTPTLLMGASFELVSDEGYLNNPYRSVRYLDPDSPVGYAYQKEIYPHTRVSNAASLNARYFLPYRAADLRRVPLLHRLVGHRLDDGQGRLHAPVAREMDLRGRLSLVRPDRRRFLLRPVPARGCAELPRARQGAVDVHEPHDLGRRDATNCRRSAGASCRNRRSTSFTTTSCTTTRTSATCAKAAHRAPSPPTATMRA